MGTFNLGLLSIHSRKSLLSSIVFEFFFEYGDPVMKNRKFKIMVFFLL